MRFRTHFLARIWALPTFVVFVGVTALALLTGGCSWQPAIKPSVLVILVENLGFGAFSCSDEVEPVDGEGFHAFCQEAVRFTHAYAPSTLSQASIASILTAQYPREHGVRHNGAQGLPASVVTLAETALQHGYRTSFVSGGPPIWRRSGINQGFDLFDDSVQVSLRRLYRPAGDVMDLFLNWQELEAPRGRFFSFLYLADLQFVDVGTTNELGELRESSYRSQLEEVSESLGHLVKRLKERKVWDSTDVFLVGLDGFTTETRFGETAGMNLFSESTRSTVMIKPARKKRDGPFNWKIDSNISLVDIGATLFEIIAPEKHFSFKNGAQSLKSVLLGPKPSWPADRLIVSESAWPSWRGAGGIRAAARKGPLLYLFDHSTLLFNTLTDNLEAGPIPQSDSRSTAVRGELAEAMEGLGYQPWKLESPVVLAKAVLGRDLWRNREPLNETLDRLQALSRRYPDDAELVGWRAIWAMRRNDWAQLKALAGAPGKKPERPTWAYVAARNLGERAAVPADPCFQFLNEGSPRQVSKACEAEGVSELLQWSDPRHDEQERERAMESLMRYEVARALSTRVAEHNYVTGLKWDTPLARLSAPDTLDLLLALPEMKKYRASIRARILKESRAP